MIKIIKEKYTENPKPALISNEKNLPFKNGGDKFVIQYSINDNFAQWQLLKASITSFYMYNSKKQFSIRIIANKNIKFKNDLIEFIKSDPSIEINLFFIEDLLEDKYSWVYSSPFIWWIILIGIFQEDKLILSDNDMMYFKKIDIELILNSTQFLTGKVSGIDGNKNQEIINHELIFKHIKDSAKQIEVKKYINTGFVIVNKTVGKRQWKNKNWILKDLKKFGNKLKKIMGRKWNFIPDQEYVFYRFRDYIDSTVDGSYNFFTTNSHIEFPEEFRKGIILHLFRLSKDWEDRKKTYFRNVLYSTDNNLDNVVEEFHKYYKNWVMNSYLNNGLVKDDDIRAASESIVKHLLLVREKLN